MNNLSDSAPAEEVAPNLYLGKKHYVHGNLEMIRATQTIGTADFNLSATNSIDTQFQIDATVPNLGRSVVGFRMLLTTAANNATLWAGNLPYWSNVTTKTRTNQVVTDLSELHYMTEITNRLQPYSEIMHNGDTDGTVKYYNGPSISTTNVLDRVYSDTATTITVDVRVPFRYFPHSVLSLDKSIYFGQPLNLFFRWNPLTHLGYASSTGLSPTACAISGLFVEIATETRPDIIEMLKAKVESPEGLSILTDFPIFSQSQLSGTRQTAKIDISAAYGQRLRRVYSMFGTTTPYPFSRYDHSYVPSSYVGITPTPLANVLSISSSMASVKIHNQDFVISSKDVYRYLRPLLIGTGSLKNSEFETNPIFVDWWDAGKPVGTTENIIEGMELDNKEKSYSVTVNLSASVDLTHYLLAVTQREMIIRPNLITLI
jgi:hypothetical protein